MPGFSRNPGGVVTGKQLGRIPYTLRVKLGGKVQSVSEIAIHAVKTKITF
jgi:hypothetical protein